MRERAQPKNHNPTLYISLFSDRSLSVVRTYIRQQLLKKPSLNKQQQNVQLPVLLYANFYN